MNNSLNQDQIIDVASNDGFLTNYQKIDDRITLEVYLNENYYDGHVDAAELVIRFNPSHATYITGTFKSNPFEHTVINENDASNGSLRISLVTSDPISDFSTKILSLELIDNDLTSSLTADITGFYGHWDNYKDAGTTSLVIDNTNPTGSVSIRGTATQGHTLTASNTLADIDGLGDISYQWNRDDVAITDATATTYTLTQDDVGALITVTASYTDGYGADESATSSSTSAVSNVNDSLTGSVSITGTATQGHTLTASNTLADIDGLGDISYQWNRDDVAITDATGTTYTLTQDDVGALITVTASYTDGYGADESATSSSTSAVSNVNDRALASINIDVEHPVHGATYNVSIDYYEVKTNDSGLISTVNVQPVDVINGSLIANDVLVTEAFLDSDIHIKPIKSVTEEQLSDITVYDALDALKIAIGLAPSQGEVQEHHLIAADIDQSGDVSVYDALGILKTAIGLEASSAPKWAFINKDYQPNDNPFYVMTADDIQYQESMTILDIQNDVFSEFEAVLLGDVDMSFTEIV